MKQKKQINIFLIKANKTNKAANNKNMPFKINKNTEKNTRAAMTVQHIRNKKKETKNY